MQNPPLVSVIVPLFNHEKWVTSCIQSIADSSYPRLEIFVLDDGSSDNSLSTAMAILDKEKHRFENIWIETQPNIGINKTLNKLISKTNGKYIYPIASDDEVTVDGIEKCVSFSETCNDNDSLIVTNVELIDAQGEAYLNTKMDGYLVGAPDWIVKIDLMLHWGTPYQHHFFSRKAYERLGGYDESFAYEDLYFALRFISRDNVRFIFDKIKRYRLHRNGLPTPGISAEGLRLSPIYVEASKHARLLEKYLMLLVAKSESSHVSRFAVWATSVFLRHFLLPIFRKPVARPPREST